MSKLQELIRSIAEGLEEAGVTEEDMDRWHKEAVEEAKKEKQRILLEEKKDDEI